MRPRPTALAAYLALVPATLAGQADTVLYEPFDAGWGRSWVFRPLDRRATEFTVVPDAGNRVLHAVSRNAAAGVWRMLDVSGVTGLQAAWRWRVERVLDNPRERTRRGDDYPARVMIAFDAPPLDRGARVLCYVWAAGEPVGAVYPNPYRANVMTVVLRSGADPTGVWVTETPDLAADFRRAFGRDPETVTGLAVVVDTDDTGGEAAAWFDDLTLWRRP